MGLQIKNNKVIGYSEEVDNYEVIIPEGVTEICKYAFYMAKKLKKINISNSVTEIGYGAFECCKNLKEIILPSNIKIIKDFVFFDCKSLTNIKLPDSVLKLGNGTFAFCENLKEITIPDSVIKIDLDPSLFYFKRFPTFCYLDKLEIINIYSYRVFNLLDSFLKSIAIFSVIKNYYTGKIVYSSDDMLLFREYIIEHKMDIFCKVLRDYTLLDSFNYILNEMEVYTIKDIDILLNLIERSEKINIELSSLILTYKNRNFGFKNSLDELTLDDGEDEKGKVLKK